MAINRDKNADQSLAQPTEPTSSQSPGQPAPPKDDTQWTCSDALCPCMKAARQRNSTLKTFTQEDIDACGWTQGNYPACKHTKGTGGAMKIPGRIHPGNDHMGIKITAVSVILCGGLAWFLMSGNGETTEWGEDEPSPTDFIDEVNKNIFRGTAVETISLPDPSSQR